MSLSNTAFAVVTAGLKGSARRISADTGGGGSKDGEALCQVPCGFALPTCGGEVRLDEEDDPERVDEPDKHYLVC